MCDVNMAAVGRRYLNYTHLDCDMLFYGLRGRKVAILFLARAKPQGPTAREPNHSEREKVIFAHSGFVAFVRGLAPSPPPQPLTPAPSRA